MNIERRFDPYDSSNAPQTKERVLAYLEERQRINVFLDPYKPETTITLDKSDFPLKTVHAGDTHLAYVASKISGLPNAVKETGKDGILITHANLIDSVSNKFISTNTINVGLNLDQQTDLAKQILSPVDKKGRLIVIGANTCHEGWSYKTSTHDCTLDLIRKETPMLYNGGQIILKEEDIEVGRIEGYHNGGKGMTKWSPEGSMRERSREVPDGSKDKANVFIDAHMHQLTVAVDYRRNPITKKDTRTILGEVGASKGTKDNPDRFINGFGVAPRNQPGDCGEGVEVIWKKNYKSKEIIPYPVADYDRAKIIFEAEKLYEDTQRTGTYREIYEEIMDSGKFNKPKKKLVEEDCRLREQDINEDGPRGTSPLYESITHNIKTNLPIRIHFIGNSRVGSSSFERNVFKSDLKNIESDPWAYFYAMGNLINRSTATSFDREKKLEDLSDLLGLASTSALGIMLSDELMSSAWKKGISKKNKEGEKEKINGLLPGDIIYESLDKNVPIILPETVSFLNLKSPNKKETPYTLYLRKELSHFTSLINPYHGLTRISQIWGIDADLLVGGNTEVVGWRTWMRPNRQLEVLVPGGYSKYDKKGTDNRVDYPSGGQGSIIFPDQKRVYSFASFEEGRDMHESLILYEALRQLGTLPVIRKKLIKIN